jgi:hypothetical protein
MLAEQLDNLILLGNPKGAGYDSNNRNKLQLLKFRT